MNDIPTARAYEFAKAAFASIGQKRKYSGDNYIVHSEAVVRILEQCGEDDQNVLVAALLHDVAEDVSPHNPEYDSYEILRHFGAKVANYVLDLTDEFTFDKYPNMNRAERKSLEAKRISTISDNALKIKLADILHNTADIKKVDPTFSTIYLSEKEQILGLLYPRMMTTENVVLKTIYHRVKAQLEFNNPPRQNFWQNTQ